MQEDYFIRQLKEVSKVLAIILGLSDKGEIEEAIKISEKGLKSEFGFSSDFTFDDLKTQLASGKLQLNDLSQILDLVMVRAKLFTEQSKELAIAEYDKSLQIITFIEDKTSTFDFSILQKKSEIISNQNKLNGV